MWSAAACRRFPYITKKMKNKKSFMLGIATPLALGVLLASSGCRTLIKPAEEGMPPLRQAYAEGNYEAAMGITAEVVEEVGNKFRTPSDAWLWHVCNAMVLRQCGEYKRSAEEFEAGNGIFNFVKMERSLSLLKLKDRYQERKYFPGPDETSAMLVWLALTCQQAGDADGGLGYLQNWDKENPGFMPKKTKPLDVWTDREDIAAMRKRIRERRQNTQNTVFKSKSKKPPPPPSLEDTLCPEEDRKELEIRLWESVVRQNILEGFEKEYGKKMTDIPRREEVDLLLPQYLYFLTLWTQGDDNTKWNDLEQMAALLKDSPHPVVKQDVARYDPESPMETGSSVYVFFETGSAPKWREWHQMINASPLRSDILHKITFPRLCFDKNYIPWLDIVTTQQERLKTELIWDAERIAVQHFSVAFPDIAKSAAYTAVRSAVRHIVAEDSFKKFLAKQTNINIRESLRKSHEEKKRKDEAKAVESCKTANAVSDRDAPPAYFYGYSLLQPANVQVARLDMPPDRKLTLAFPNGKWKQDITVIPGEVVVVWVKSAHDRQPGPRVSQFRFKPIYNE